MIFLYIVVREGDACLHIGAAMRLSLSMSSRAVGWDFRGEIKSYKTIETVTLLHLRASFLFLSSGSLSSLVRHLHLMMQKSAAGSWDHSCCGLEDQSHPGTTFYSSWYTWDGSSLQLCCLHRCRLVHLLSALSLPLHLALLPLCSPLSSWSNKSSCGSLSAL